MKKKSLFKILLASSIFITLFGCGNKSHEHVYIHVDEVPASCTVDGVEEHYTCEKCDLLFDLGKKEVNKEDLIIKAHHMIETISSSQETCTEDGYYTYYHCTVCGKNFADEDGENEIDLEDVTIPKTGHNLHFHAAKEATCTEGGNNAYYLCEKCHKYYSDENGEHELTLEEIHIPSLGHDLIVHEAKEATCTEDGNSLYFECDRCHKYFSDELGLHEIEDNSWVIEGHHEMEYVQASEPTFEEEGIIEHYHCDKCNKNFSDENGENEITTPVVLPRLLKHLDFETDDSLMMIVEDNRNTYSISEEQAYRGNKSLKITTGKANTKGLIISDKYYDMLPEEGLIFSLYTSTAFNGDVGSGMPIYNGGHAIEAKFHYWEPLNVWKEYHIAKASIKPTSGDHWVFTVGAVATIYIDDIYPASNTIGFENSYDRNLILDDNRNTVSLSNEQALGGNTSLKVTTSKANNIAFLLSDVFYNSLPEEGITFSLFSNETIFNGNVYNGNDESSLHYWSPIGIWKQYTVAKEHINPTKGNHWVFTLPIAVTIYIDNIFPADIASKANGTGFEEEYSLLVAHSDERNAFNISQDFAYEGNSSLKVTNTESYTKGLIISDALYNKLPDEGITFYIYAEIIAFNGPVYNGDDEVSVHYWNPLGEWKKFTVAKANINPTAGDHWVFTIGAVTTLYIDNVSIAVAA